MILNYFEAEEFLREELSKIENIKSWCTDHKLDSKYHLIINIKNKKSKKKYTNLIISLLYIFGYDVKELNHLKITKRQDHEGKPDITKT